MDLGKLYEALSKAQGVMSSAEKSKDNAFFKSSYADLHAVWEVCRKPLADNGLSVVQTIEIEDGKYILSTTLGHSSGQSICSRMPLLPKEASSQALGSAITYARRYSLSAIVGVSVTEEDDDGERSMGRDKSLQKHPDPVESVKEDPKLFLTPQQVEQVSNLIGPDEDFKKAVLNGYGVKTLTEIKLTPKQFTSMINGLNRKNEERLKNEMEKI